MYMKRHGSLTVIILSLILAAATPGLADEALVQRADSLFGAEDFAGAVEAYRAVVAEDSTDAVAWLHLGVSLQLTGAYSEAIDAFTMLLESSYVGVLAAYNIGCVYALQGMADSAFLWLDSAAAGGLRDDETLADDEDLASLRQDPRFKALLARVRVNSRPCEYDENYDRLDFWLGDWDVFLSDGRKAGENTIEKILGGCAVRESWTSVNGGKGSSVNYYNPAGGKWYQRWVDDNGRIIEYEGTFRDGAMHFLGTHVERPGEVYVSRMLLSPLDDGRVLQVIELSEDDGETWLVWFEGIYSPRP